MDDEHLIHIFTDVTPIKQAQLQLERTVEDLKRSNINLEEFAYAASHDMKEPIRKIHFFSDRLKHDLKGLLTEEQSRWFTRMEAATMRMKTLIDDLLTYSQVSRGVSSYEEVDLNQNVQGVLEDLELEIQERGAKITLGKLPIIKGHKRQLQQLFQNLISNALKYSKTDTTPEIKIHSQIVTGAENVIPLNIEEIKRQFHLIQISDNGIGFAQKDANRIFNVFTRLHGNSDVKGTGVGLSIARKVVENHRGYIWAESGPGIGSVFSILIPVD
jgi:light-regulated signal transduction histidine kinase (bacteriophytochrome)